MLFGTGRAVADTPFRACRCVLSHPQVLVRLLPDRPELRAADAVLTAVGVQRHPLRWCRSSSRTASGPGAAGLRRLRASGSGLGATVGHRRRRQVAERIGPGHLVIVELRHPNDHEAQEKRPRA
ncbi:hypothetical protein F750_6419 [Streptomyces sp. PAMC 26508]|nr:hypothetical protein F750_6419 [Streptomyces sp. PAMC 26508]